MNSARAIAFALTLLAVCLEATPVVNKQAQPFPAFTLVHKITFYDAEGRATPLRDMTLYASGKGDWRRVWTYARGRTQDTIFIPRRGVYFTDEKRQRLIRLGDGGGPHANMAEDLRASSKFVRTEYVLGYLTYVQRDEIAGYLYEHYFAVETGPFPLKSVLFHDGYKVVTEPLSLTFGEPPAEQLRDASYTLDEGRAVFDKELSRRVTEQPPPQYPPELKALAASSKMVLQVFVDESGRVLRANMISGHPLLEEAAVEAAFGVRFTPTTAGGQPGKATGLITYQPAPR